MDRMLAAILSTDVAAFSRLAALDEERTVRALSLCHDRIAALVSEHGGRIFGSAGDGLVAEFPSAVQAVRCAVEIQRELPGLSADLPQYRRLEFRIGVNLADVMTKGLRQEGLPERWLKSGVSWSFDDRACKIKRALK